MSFHDINHTVMYATNTASVASTAAAIMGWLPPLLAAIASMFTIVWLGLQIAAHPLFNRIIASIALFFKK